MEDQILLDTELLNKVWSGFIQELEDAKLPKLIIPKDYNFVSRRSRPAKRFEDWLFTQGAIIVQENRRRYIRFINKQRELFFILKYS